jgi:uncharacterized glyoxalase superfamily protein PhnB
MNGDFMDMIGGLADMFGLGEVVKGVLGGANAYASGRSTQAGADNDGVPYVYERLLTRPRDPGINDRYTSILRAWRRSDCDAWRTTIGYTSYMNPTHTPVTARAIFPSLKYDNAPRAIEFLCNAFGFEKYAQFPNTGFKSTRAQLRLGSNFIMVGATTTDSGPISTPAALAGALGGIQVVLEHDADVDQHYARARSAGATIVLEPQAAENGGRNYIASDSEGYVWSFTSERLA